MEIILVASDHGGFEFKTQLLSFATQTLPDFRLVDLGVHSADSVDYPDLARMLCNQILAGVAPRGILICGSGQGMAIQANRFKGIRAALCWNEESARLSRAHNHSNVLCLGGRLLAKEVALQTAQAWLTTAFEGGRHAGRVDKVDRPL